MKTIFACPNLTLAGINFNKLGHMLYDIKIKKNQNCDDQRYSICEKLDTLVMSYYTQLFLERDYVFGKQSVLPKLMKFVINDPNINKEDLFIYLENYDVTLRTSFNLLFLFYVEVFMQSVSTALKIKLNRQGIQDVSKEVLKELFPESWESKRNKISIMAELRNTLHNGGVWKHQNKSINHNAKMGFFRILANIPDNER